MFQCKDMNIFSITKVSHRKISAFRPSFAVGNIPKSPFRDIFRWHGCCPLSEQKNSTVMKKIILSLLLAAGFCSVAYAQRFKVGVRVGADMVDYSSPRIEFAGGSVSHGSNRVGFETALIGRLNITRHLHLQTEFEFSRTGYAFRYHYAEGYSQRNIKIHANRIEIPLQIGINAGPVRLFGGVAFRVAHSEKSNAPSLLKVKFNDSNIGLTGGVGVNIRRFFIDARITGYPRSTIYNTFTSNGETHRTAIGRHIRWSVSTGFFF